MSIKFDASYDAILADCKSLPVEDVTLLIADLKDDLAEKLARQGIDTASLPLADKTVERAIAKASESGPVRSVQKAPDFDDRWNKAAKAFLERQRKAHALRDAFLIIAFIAIAAWAVPALFTSLNDLARSSK